MAKRKRLNPAAAFGDTGPDEAASNARVGWVGAARPPIADVSQDAATHAAFEEVAGELKAAREEGRMVARLPLEAVEETHLVRDRIHVNDDDMAALTDSLRDRGQQTPIEVVDLGAGRFGLISGWRRLMALRALVSETGDDRFSHVQALIRTPQGASDAYRAMVEENEIRADLSFYERARIAVQAARQGIYPDTKKAVHALFAAARAPKRSKIVAFTTLVDALDDVLRFPQAIPEKLGLALVAALNENPALPKRLEQALTRANPEEPTAERAVLEKALKDRGSKDASRPAPPPAETLAPGLKLHRKGAQLTLSGKAVDDDLVADLKRWLAARGDAE